MPRGGKRDGAGRKAGVPNKITADLKAAIMQAFENVGGSDYLTTLASSHPQVYCALLGKVLPTALAGADGEGPLIIRWMNGNKAGNGVHASNGSANGKDDAGAEHGLPPVDGRH